MQHWPHNLIRVYKFFGKDQPNESLPLIFFHHGVHWKGGGGVKIKKHNIMNRSTIAKTNDIYQSFCESFNECSDMFYSTCIMHILTICE